MRLLVLAAALSLAACATPLSIGAGANASNDANATSPNDRSAWPFPQAPRGSALAPPQTFLAQTAPPLGRTANGIDFGQWRSAEPSAYSLAFQNQMAAREQGRDAAAVKADLEGAGFACDSGARLDCRIEITDNQCPQDWYVVLDGGEVHAGYEKSCAARVPTSR